MKSTHAIFLAGLLAVLSSCGESIQDAKNAYSVMKNASEISDNYVKAQSEAQKKLEERRAKGDTLAMNYKELQKFLPSEIKGYTGEGEIEGNSVNMEGMSYSSVEHNYKKGDSYLNISLVDYNSAHDLYSGLTAMWATGMSIEDNNQIANGTSLKNGTLKGWEVYHKEEKRAELMLGVVGRFFLSISLDQQDNTDLIKEIAESLDLSELEKL
ncbi:MAG: hypothetical protein ACK4ND_02415 [Cytophagaceae bacterium]